MKTTACLFCCTLLAALACNSAGADDFKVNITARVSAIDDPANALGDQMQLGQLFTGYYNYDSGAPPMHSGSPNVGRYQLMGPTAGVKLTSGTVVLESDVPNAFTDIYISANDPGTGYDVLDISYRNDNPLNNGALVGDIRFNFTSTTGQAPHTTALPTTAPDLQYYDSHTVYVWGFLNSDVFQVTLDIESVELVPPLVLEVSPGPSLFLPQQRFDAVLRLSAGSTIVSAQATANRSTLPLSYPGTCQLAPPDSLGRPAILCPDTHNALTTAPGTTLVEWSVELMDGTVLTEAVEWTVLQ